MVAQTKTLPASWYCSQPLYELEQRAIFLKAWYLLGPVTRFQNEEKVSYEMAGVAFVVENLKYQSGKLPSGKDLKVSRLSDGHPLPQKLTSSGLLFAATSPSAPSFEEYFPGLEGLLSRVDFTKLPFKRTLSYEGKFNWKTMIDGYQECLHCQYTHKSFSQLYPTTFYTVTNHGNFSQHFVNKEASTSTNAEEDGLFLYFFPNCTLNVYGGGMTSFRTCPLSSSSSSSTGEARMEFDYYHQQPADSDTFARYFAFVRRVAQEDYELCERAQANLERGIYSQGVLNGEKEGGVAHYQGLVRRRVTEEFMREKKERHGESGEEMGRVGRGRGRGQQGTTVAVGG